ncbi:MAG: PilZ domain-containing protein [Myxococcales bacterium]|nr:PilZ domain-containing protein [Myxococcales bacterium]
MACSLLVGERRHTGIVLDVSATGLFIQTSASPSPNQVVDLELSIPGESEVVPVRAIVARRKAVPPRLITVAHGGLGLRIENAPEAYFTMVASLQDGGSKLIETAAPDSDKAASSPREQKAAPKSDDEKARSKPKRKLPPRQAPPPRRRFQVRIQHGARSRRLEVSAASEKDARQQALSEAGEGWKVMGCDRVSE